LDEVESNFGRQERLDIEMGGVARCDCVPRPRDVRYHWLFLRRTHRLP